MYIVDNISGYRFITHSYQKEYIRKLTPKISKMIVPADLLPHLLAKDIISDSDKENIQQEDTNRGNIAASVLLLDRITRKHSYWYKLFIKALLEANMEDVAADLQIPDLLEKKKRKVKYVCQNENDDLSALQSDPSPETHRTRAPPLKSEQSTEIKVESSIDRYVGHVSAPTSHTNGLHRNGANETVNLDMVNISDDTKFKDVIDNIEETEKKIQDILVEIDLLEQKSTLHKEVICELKKRRKLSEEISLKVKEGLRADGSYQDEKFLTDDYIDTYYPTGENAKHENDNRTLTQVTDHKIKRTFDYRTASEKKNLTLSRFL